MKVLLHVCCAPCFIYPLERLREQKSEALGFFYNPNIHPVGEYQNRKNAVMDFSKAAAIEVIYPEYNSAEFFWAVHAKEDDPKRCSLCWHLRLAKAAQAAKERGFTHFSTTLLVSPYQDQGLLKEIGDGIAKEEAVGFYYEDFRPGFQKAHDEARAKGIYCQKYCGCIYSEVEQCKKSPGH